jgi:hypothetical protein
MAQELLIDAMGPMSANHFRRHAQAGSRTSLVTGEA